MLQYRFRYFNSIKVRLKLIWDDYETFETGFQFHKGTIKTTAEIQSFAFSDISIP